MSRNLLGSETSPYLLQHKDNPVHWRPWGPEALAEARAADKPILLSIGYAACHWCHVMAHESFEDAETAALMNGLFVNIKVDREERPDIDHIYMTAIHMFGEQGGWPLTMFLAPNGEPFWGGTYFPPEPRWGRPSFRQVLMGVARLYREERDSVTHNGAVVSRRLADLAAEGAGDTLAMTEIEAAADALAPLIDPARGGTRGAPKFPQFAMSELIARAGLRRQDSRLTELFLVSLERIFEGGIYDHLAGGLARYSVDDRWLVPHFEKMLYDNAGAIAALTLAHQIAPRPLFRRRIEEIAAWLETEMLTGEGAFAASLDADSEGEEGRFYVWSKDEIDLVLGPDGSELFCRIYDVTPGGNWEGRTILNRLASARDIDADTEARLAPLRARLLAARAARVRPARDDKVLTDWNGLAIVALARAGMVLGETRWLARAEAVFRSVTESHGTGDRLLHSSRGGQGGATGLAGDYTNMAVAALALYEATREGTYLDRARAWLTTLETDFADGHGAFYMAGEGADDLILRPRSGTDDPTPNANAMALEAYARLECFTGNTGFGDRAAAIGRAFAGAARQHPFAHATLFNAAERAISPLEIVIAGPDTDTDGLVRAALGVPAPTACLTVVADPGTLPADHPAAGKPANGAVAYVCAGRTCSLPVSEPEALTGLIRGTYAKSAK